MTDTLTLTANIPAVETIDMTPTWEAITPLLLTVMTDGTTEGRQAAREEIMRMARIADAYIVARAGTDANS